MTAPRRFWGPSIAIAVILLLGSGIYLKIRGSSETEGDESPDDADRPAVSATATFGTNVAIPVSGAEVVLDTLVVSVTASGEAAAWRQSRILALVDGRVERLPVRENQVVRRGAMLLAIDTVDLALAQGAVLPGGDRIAPRAAVPSLHRRPRPPRGGGRRRLR